MDDDAHTMSCRHGAVGRQLLLGVTTLGVTTLGVTTLVITLCGAESGVPAWCFCSVFPQNSVKSIRLSRCTETVK
jgi:hypothetical protein